MISVVVPTMWRYPPFPDFLATVLDHSLVSDAVLINNSSSHTPSHSVLSHPKLSIVDFGINIFVNPAWNLGVMHSGSPIVCIMNDDIVFDLALFEKIHCWYQPHHGAVGLGHSHIAQSIRFQPHVNQSCFGFGQLMVVHQHNWIPIPPELLIYFGDNWIFDTHKKRYGTNWLIEDLAYHTPHAQTSQSCGHRLETERTLYLEVLQQHNLQAWHE